MQIPLNFRFCLVGAASIASALGRWLPVDDTGSQAMPRQGAIECFPAIAGEA